MSRAKTFPLIAMLALVAACGGPKTDATDTTAATDTTRPSTPSGLTAVATGASAINLSWNASTDDVQVTGYIVRRNGTQMATPVTTSYMDTGLSATTTYSYTVAAFDAAGNTSPFSASASATTTGTGTGDTVRPSTPTGLTATAVGLVVNLSWNASTDNVGVIGYVVRRHGTPVATPATTIYVDIGLSAGITYRYTVAAVDAAGNSSSLSTSASATTVGIPPPSGIPLTLGWFPIPATQLTPVCAVTQGFTDVAGIESCPAITEDWSGGIFDEARNRLLIWGGGHGGYAGNEVYALGLDTLTMTRLNAPSSPVRNGCTSGGVYADGKPVSRHTYNHLAYLPTADAMFAWGGSMWQTGCQGDDAWTLNLSTLAWTKKSNTGGPIGNHFGVGTSFDPNSGLIYAHDGSNLFSYNPSANTWSKRSSPLSRQFFGYTSGAVDPVRKRYLLHGNDHTGSPIPPATLFWYDISNPTASIATQSGLTTGCGGFIGGYEYSMEYDPVQDRFVGWNGGDTIFLFNPDTLSCTTAVHAGGPAAVPNGTYGRFRYSPSLNVFVVCNSVNANCYTLRLTPP